MKQQDVRLATEQLLKESLSLLEQQYSRITVLMATNDAANILMVGRLKNR